MKIAIYRLGLVTRLGLLVSALLLGQQAFAAGTVASTPVNNRATVGYSVSAVPQTVIESSPTGNSTPGVAVPGAGEDTVFVVDRRVDFTLTLVDGALAAVDVGDTDTPIEYLLTNTSNSALDFALSADNAADGAVTLRVGDPADDADLNAATFRVRVSAQSDVTAGGTGPDPTLGDPVNVINLASEDSIRIFVFSDIPGTLPDQSVALVELTATAAEPNSAAATLLTEIAGTGLPLVVDNVWTNGPVAAGSNYFLLAREGYLISSAALTITKTSDVYSDPINGVSANAKAIPGAEIEYSIEVANGGATDATGVVITDNINAEVSLVADAYGVGQDVVYDIDGGGDSYCNASDGDATDGCALVAGLLTLDGTGPGPAVVFDVAAGETLTVRFRVLIPAVP